MLTRLIARAKFVARVLLECDQYTHHCAVDGSGQGAHFYALGGRFTIHTMRTNW
jgi:hypothetical protein